VENPLAQRADHDLRPILHAQFHEESFQPKFRRRPGQAYHVADFLVAAAFDKQFQHFRDGGAGIAATRNWVTERGVYAASSFALRTM
jgi:hypothetical protein